MPVPLNKNLYFHRVVECVSGRNTRHLHVRGFMSTAPHGQWLNARSVWRGARADSIR